MADPLAGEIGERRRVVTCFDPPPEELVRGRQPFLRVSIGTIAALLAPGVGCAPGCVVQGRAVY